MKVWKKRNTDAEKSPHLTGANANGGGGGGVSEEEEDLGVNPEESEKFEAAQEDFEGGGEEESEAEKEYEQQENVHGVEAEMEGVEGGERPKLAEGYYEIETVRRKRVRKGQLQYLIKWRGWSEAANTWEPADNLVQCSDILDAFEESLKAGKTRSTRKRKRQVGITHVQIKKKQHQSSSSAPTYNVPSRVRRTADPIIPLRMQNDSNSINTSIEKVNDNGVRSVRPTVEAEKEQNELNFKLCVFKGQDADGLAITSQEGQVAGGDASANGSRKSDTITGPRTGAKKRKSGSVKRFKKDPEPCSDAPENAVDAACDVVESLGVQQPDFVGNDSNGKNKSEDSRSMFNIAQIVKPISCKASTSNNEQEVLVAFEAVRSDGTKVTVDNKFLKANNPLLLIDFYEKHLRYIPE